MLQVVTVVSQFHHDGCQPSSSPWRAEKERKADKVDDSACFSCRPWANSTIYVRSLQPNFTLSRLDCPAANFIVTLNKQSDGESRRDRSFHDTHVQSSSRTAAQLYRLSFVTALAGGNRRTVPGFCNRFHMRANFCEDVHHQ